MTSFAVLQISALGMGGYHLGAAKDEQAAIELAHGDAKRPTRTIG